MSTYTQVYVDEKEVYQTCTTAFYQKNLVLKRFQTLSKDGSIGYLVEFLFRRSFIYNVLFL